MLITEIWVYAYKVMKSRFGKLTRVVYTGGK